MYIGHDGRDYSTLEDLKRANEEYNARTYVKINKPVYNPETKVDTAPIIPNSCFLDRGFQNESSLPIRAFLRVGDLGLDGVVDTKFLYK